MNLFNSIQSLEPSSLRLQENKDCFELVIKLLEWKMYDLSSKSIIDYISNMNTADSTLSEEQKRNKELLESSFGTNVIYTNNPKFNLGYNSLEQCFLYNNRGIKIFIEQFTFILFKFYLDNIQDDSYFENINNSIKNKIQEYERTLNIPTNFKINLSVMILVMKDHSLMKKQI